MILTDAIFRIYDFIRAFLLAGQVPQDNVEGDIFNFFAFLINLFSFIPF